jgi:hypothetical protein
MASSTGRRAKRNAKDTCRGVKDKAGKKYPRESQIKGPHLRAANGYGPFTKDGEPNKSRCAKGKYSSTGRTFAYARNKSTGMAMFKSSCTLQNEKLRTVESSDFCISRAKGKSASLRQRPCLTKELKVVKPTKPSAKHPTGKCRKGSKSNRGEVRFKAYKAAQRAAKRAAKKGAANRGRRAATRRCHVKSGPNKGQFKRCR